MVRHLTEGAEGVVAAGAYAHGAARLLHDGRLAAGARAVHHVRHQVQAGLQQQAVVARKELLPNQLFNLSRGRAKKGGTRLQFILFCNKQRVSESAATAGMNPLYYLTGRDRTPRNAALINQIQSAGRQTRWDVTSRLTKASTNPVVRTSAP